MTKLHNKTRHAAPFPDTTGTDAEPTPDKSADEIMAGWMDWIIEDESSRFEIDAGDPGGAVKMGVTFETFVLWRNLHGKPRPTLCGACQADARGCATGLCRTLVAVASNRFVHRWPGCPHDR